MGINSISLKKINSEDVYGNQSFLITFEPKAIGSEKIFWFVKRKKVEVKIRLFTIKEIISRAISSNTSLTPAIEDLLSVGSEQRKLFFYQPKIIYGKEHFVLIFADKNYDSEKFANHSFSISMNKYFWKVAQTKDIIVSLDSGGSHSIFIDGEKYKYSLFQKYIKEFGDLNKALADCLGASASFIELERESQDPLSMILFSDLHLADKSAIDNFGSIKEKRLIEMLVAEAKNKDVYIIVPGDFFDLWQTTIGNIEKAYSGKDSLLGVLSRMKNLILIAGNHDESIIDKKIVGDWIAKQLPNAKVLSNAMISSKNIDLVVYHGDKQDSSNNHTIFGRTVSRIASLLEKSVKGCIDPLTGRSSLEQRMMGLLERNFAPTKILIESYIIRNLTSFITDINVYLHWNKKKLRESEENRKFAIILGHTHELLKNNGDSSIQTVLKMMIDEFIKETPDNEKWRPSYLISKIDVRYINTGTGSGESLLDERTKSKTRWKKVLKKMEDLKAEGLGYYEYLRREGGFQLEGVKDIRLGKQDSIFIYEDNSGGVQFSYTETDYMAKSRPIEF